MSETTSLWALFTSGFLAATLLPGGSEVVLYGVLELHPGQYWLAQAQSVDLGVNHGARQVCALPGDRNSDRSVKR